jgi:HAD superfamily hydrolase (TIGR01509 family)
MVREDLCYPPVVIEAVLFDNDGVLVDTEKLYFEAGRVTLADVGIELTLDTYQEISLRQGRSVMDLAAERGFGEAEVAALRERRDHRYARSLEQGVPVIPGTREAVARLRQEGKRLAIVTTCPGRHFVIQHRHTGLRAEFELVLVREDYARSKPFADPYATAVQRLGLDASSCVAIEDTQRGVDAANAAGVRCFGCRSPMTRGTTFEGAVDVLDSVRDLPAAVERLERG